MMKQASEKTTRVINWLAFQPTQGDIRALRETIHDAIPARTLRQLLVHTALQQYPWQGRTDLISVYHPAQSYLSEKWVALLQPDPQKLRPTAWLIAQVVSAKTVRNPIQGTFQNLTLLANNKQVHIAAAIPKARFFTSNFSAPSKEDLEWLSAWFADRYKVPLQAALEKLIRSKHLSGKLVGDQFIPSHLAALDPAQLTRFFEHLSITHPWVSAQEILRAVPDFQILPINTMLALLRAALLESGYHPLGGDRWTTQGLYEQLNREIPRGLPIPRVRSKLDIWTEKDEQDFNAIEETPFSEDAYQDLEDEPVNEATPIQQDTWQPLVHPARLRTLNYLHITQAYFPIGGIIRAFSPDVGLVWVQIIQGNHQPFLVDRHQEALKALDIENLRTTFLEAGIPAGTHLWLEYQGDEQYRIAPRPLPSPLTVPCKLAYMEDGKLRIEHTEIPMMYEGDPSVFKAEMRFSDIEALFAEARRCQLSVLDATIQSVQELCAVDPRGQAHRLDIFNAVFLKRMCSPASVPSLLTKPCFVKLGDGYYRYTDIRGSTTTKRKNRTRKKLPEPAIFIPEPSEPQPVVEQGEPPLIEPEVILPDPLPTPEIVEQQPVEEDMLLFESMSTSAPTEMLVEPIAKPSVADQRADTHEPLPVLVSEGALVNQPVPETPTVAETKTSLEHPALKEPLVKTIRRRKSPSITRRIWLLVERSITGLFHFLWRKHGK